jgi:MotA/TolQ/ExbB proton channel family
LEAFQSAPAPFSKKEAIEASQRAMDRCRAMIHAELKVGLCALANIASLAPFFGLSGTLLGISNSFRGVGMSRATWVALMANSIADALVPTAAGLLVGIITVSFYNCLIERLEVFDAEMANASLDAVSYLNTQLVCCKQIDGSIEAAFVGVLSGRLTRDCEVSYDCQYVLLISVWALLLYFVFVLGQGFSLALRARTLDVAF